LAEHAFEARAHPVAVARALLLLDEDARSFELREVVRNGWLTEADEVLDLLAADRPAPQVL